MLLWACLTQSANGQACYPGATWPKLIGYGNVDTNVVSIDRNSNDELVFLVESLEADFVGNAATTDVSVIMTLDAASDTYMWSKVVEGTYTGNANQVYYSPDGHRVLLFHHTYNTVSANPHIALMFFDADSGTVLGIEEAFLGDLNWGTTYSRDQLTMSSTGEYQYWLLNRNGNSQVTLHQTRFSGLYWYDEGYLAWGTIANGDANKSKMRYSLVLSPDETKLMTFTSSTRASRTQKELECRLDVWDVTGYLSSVEQDFYKGSSSLLNRNCRFPAVHSDGTDYVITLVAEYFDYSKSQLDFTRYRLKQSDYTDRNGNEDRMYWDGSYETTKQLVITTAYFPNIDDCYAMAVDQVDNQNYLIYFSWNDPNLAPDFWSIKGWSENPEAAAYAGNAHLAALIYGVNSDTNDFPVYGYMVGGVSSVWTYDDCLAPDFGISVESYLQLVTSPGSGAKLGIIDRIELDVTSCNKDQVVLINNYNGAIISDISTTNQNFEIATEYATTDGLTFMSPDPTVLDLSTASNSGISLGDWESSMDLTSCAIQSADETFIQYTEALFEGDDIIEYEIGSGPYNVPFIDWLDSSGSCTVDMIYDSRAVDDTGTVTTDLNLITPTFSNLNVGIDSSDISNLDKDFVVTILARSDSNQCLQKDFTVKLFSCTITQLTGAQWVTYNSNQIIGYDYTIGQGAVTEQFNFVSSIAACSVFETIVYEESPIGSGTWIVHDGSVITVAEDTVTVLQVGQHRFDVTWNTSDLSYDPGTGFTGLSISYQISIAAPNHATASSTTNPRTIDLSIDYRNECRDIIVSPQVMTMIENTIYEPLVTQSVSDFTFSPALTGCGTQSIAIYEDGFGAVAYSNFITTSGMNLQLVSTDPTHVGDYYLKVEVTFSAFPMTYRNTYDLLVRLKPSCQDDVFSAATWDQSSSQSIAAYDHSISLQTDTYHFSPSVINSLNAYCTIMFTLQEFSGGVWSDYTGSLASLDSATQILTLTSAIGDVALDGTSKKFRVAIASVTDLSIAASPVYIEVNIDYIHPCHSAVFSDNGGVSATPIVTTAYSPTHPSPQTIPITDFPYNLQPGIDCGTQTINLSPVGAITPGTMADFISNAQVGLVWTLTAAATNTAQETYTYTMQLDVVLDSYSTVTYTSPTTFDVQIRENCNGGTVNGFQWSSNAATTLPLQSLFMDGSVISETFAATSSLAHCVIVYDLEIYDSGTAGYVAYTASDMVLDDTLLKVTITSTDGTLDQVTNQMRVRASLSDGGSSTSGYQDIYFEILWTSICWSLTPTLDIQYANLETYVFGPTVSNTMPNIVTTPYPGTNCGTTSMEVIWPAKDRVEKFTTYSNGDFSVTSTDVYDLGEYSIGVRIWYDNYPTVEFMPQFKVTITECTPTRITPPATPIAEIIHVIGTKQSKRAVDDFTEDPVCLSDLTYILLDSDGNALDTDLQVTIDQISGQRWLFIETQRFSLAGTYELQIVAEHKYGMRNTKPYFFDLVLLTPDGFVYNNEEAEFPGIDGDTLLDIIIPTTGSNFTYTIPPGFDKEDDDIEMSVFLGEAADFLSYNEDSGTFFITDPNAVLREGDFEIIVTLSDGDSARDYLIKIKVEDLVQEEVVVPIEFVDPVDIDLGNLSLQPVITEVTTLGLLTLTWNKDIIQPKNETYFVERLTREIETIDVHTEKVIQTVAFEVEIVPSYMHSVDLTMDWEYVEWANNRELKIQLLFSDPKVVSMEIPADFVNITFWDQELFVAQGAQYVPKQLEITKQLAPQIEDGDLADLLGGLSNGIMGLTYAGGIGSALLALVMGLSLSLLWSLLHAVQLIVHLPLFSVQFPGNAFLLYESLIAIARMDLIDAEQFFSRSVFGLDEDEDEGPYSMEFERLQYNAQNFWLIVDFMLLPTMVLVLLVLLSMLLQCGRKHSETVKRISSNINKLIYYSFFLRLIMEMSLEFSVAAFIDLRVRKWDVSSGYVVSSVLAVLALLSMVWFVAYIHFSVLKKYSTLKNKTVFESIGCVYEGLNIKSKPWSLKWTQWFVVRRVIYAGAAFYARTMLWLQFIIIFHACFFTMGLIGYLRPFENPKMQKVEFTNEVFFILLLYHMVCFSDFVTDAAARTDMGLSCSFVTVVALIFNIVLLAQALSGGIRLILKRCINRKEHRKQMEMKALRLASLQANQNPQVADLDELQRQMVTVDVKAKQFSYLTAQAHANAGKILPNQGANLNLSNLNQRKAFDQGKQSQLIEEEKKIQQAGTAGHSIDQPANFNKGDYGSYRGFNVDLQMFPQNEATDLTKLFYGEGAGKSPAQGASSTTEKPHLDAMGGFSSGPPAFLDMANFELKPKQKEPLTSKQQDQLRIFDDMPAGIGKKLHFSLL